MHTSKIAFLFILVAVVQAAPADQPPIPIVSFNIEGPNPDGSYSYNYETGNGISAQERGQVQQQQGPDGANHVEGGYRYTGTDGANVVLSYVADQNGFQPQGDHLPASLRKSIEYLVTHVEEDTSRN